jgi:hypothetical protein
VPDGAPRDFDIQVLEPRSDRPVAEQSGSGESIEAGPGSALAKLAAGEYRWRVRLGDGPWSRARAVRIELATTEAPKPVEVPALKAPAPVLKPPALKAPKPKGRPKFVPRFERHGSTWWNWLEAAAEADETGVEPQWDVWLEWTAVPGAARYHVQVSRTKAFQAVLSEGDALQPKWAWAYKPGEENSQGRVFYRVAAVGADGHLGPYSAPEPIAIPQEVLAAARAAKEPPKPVVKAEPEKPEEPPTPPGHWSFGWAALTTDLASFSQTASATDLTSVKAESPYLEQRLGVSGSWARGGRAWRLEAEAALARFGKAQKQALEQPNVLPLRAALWVLRGSELDVGWSWGAYAEWGFRWKRAGDLSLAADGGVSGGPALRRTWRWNALAGLRPGAARLELAAPVSGILYGHQLGGRAEAWGEWGPWQTPLSTRLAVRLRAAAELLSWNSPKGSLWLDWMTGLALTLSGR